MFKKILSYICSWFVKSTPAPVALVVESVEEKPDNLVTYTCSPEELLREAYRHGTDLAYGHVEAFCFNGVGHIRCFRDIPKGNLTPDLTVDLLGVPIDREAVSPLRVEQHFSDAERIDVSRMPAGQAWHFMERLKPDIERHLAKKAEQRAAAIEAAEKLLNDAKAKAAEITIETDKALAIAQANGPGTRGWK